MKPLLSVQDLTKHFPLRASLIGRLLTGQKDRLVHAVNGVTLDIYENETLGLVGESGSGKSTLGRVAIRLSEPTSGRISFLGDDISYVGGSRLRRLRKEMQVIFQNPYSSLNPRKSVRQIIGAALEARGVNDFEEQESEIISLLKRVSLPTRFIDAYPHQLSGGQRQRISIIRALAVRPKLIIADEPVSALDVSVQAQIIQLLEELKKEFHLTYLFIAHDLRVVWHISNRVAVMYLGKVVEIGESDEIFQYPHHPYTKALLSAIPRLDRRRGIQERLVLKGTVPSPLDPPTGCYFHTRCPEKKGRICEVQTPGWTEISKTHRVACFHCSDTAVGEKS
ncbi:MAG: ABC transporter ATP-binding protein [Deltaproteobacteria bacterium]|nr:ABC transporter ATP-binding protein [Deltaproteobacteria bacterium]